jgi:hypothetical protein
MGDDQVIRENGHRVAEDQIFVSVEDPFLAFRQTIQAEKTPALVRLSLAYVG